MTIPHHAGLALLLQFLGVGPSGSKVLQINVGGLGGLAGLIIGTGGAWLLGEFVPALPTHPPGSIRFMQKS